MRSCLAFTALTFACALAPAPAAAEARGAPVQLGNLAAPAPASWREEKPSSQMRYKQFALPRAAGDSRDAELAIFYFGARGGGSAEDNIARWKSLFEAPARGSIDDASEVRRFRVAGVQVTAVLIAGTYLHKARPLDPDLEAERRPDHRLIGAVVETRRGPYYLRLVGPRRTVDRHEKAFFAWLRALRTAG